MPGSGKIGSYHNRVAEKMKEIFNERVRFYSPEVQRWEDVCEGSHVNFDLCYYDQIRADTALRRCRENSRSNWVCVFPLCSSSNSYSSRFWISWHETWLKENSSNYILLNSGWTLFSGLQGNQEKNQILRVEWDQLPYQGNERAGHPHWHFDHELSIPIQLERIKVVSDDLTEIIETPYEEDPLVSVGFIHLAMGAWNASEEHPKCWQRNYGNDCRQLQDWCIKTLKYLKEQVAGN